MTTAITTMERPTTMAERNNDASDFAGLVTMGDQLRRTGFLPAHIKDGVSFAAIVLMGREMGMTTMAACRKLQVIKGTVTERADSQLARFKSAGGRAEFKELSETKAVLVLKHPNGDQHTETFTIEDAKRAGLASNDNYAKHPKAMLRSRAITAGLKSVGWEGAVGIYDPDEIVDTPPVVVTQPEPTPDPQPVKAATDSDMTKARTAIQRANDLGKLGDFLATVNERYESGFYTAQQADDLRNLIDTKIDWLNSSEEVPA
jgi:hypothetical protein